MFVVVVYNNNVQKPSVKKRVLFLSLSRSREKRFGVWVCVPRVTNFERTVSCREKNEKMEQKQPHFKSGV